MPEAERQPIGLHLAWLLAVAIAGAFVTVLIVVTGDVATYWPLYIIPVVLASLAYHAPGAIVSVAISSAVVVLLGYGAGYEVPPVPALTIGAVAFAISGLVIGIQTQRYRQQRQQLQRDATRDGLTGAYCADYFNARIHEEVRRSARYNQSFTLSLVDLVGFEEFQHTYGRVKAEMLLERLAEVIRLTLRGTDIVGRIESALFAVILPSAAEDDARAVAERLVSAVADAEFEGDALEPIVHRNVQVVSATYPVDATEADALMAGARARLDALAPHVGIEQSEPPRAAAADFGDAPS